MRQQVISSLRWIFIAKLIGQLINWSMTFLVLRLLSPSDYGLMAMAMIFVAIASIFSDLGLGVALVQQKELHPDQVAEIFGLLLALGVALCLLLWALAKPAAAFFDEQRLTSLIPALSLQFLLNAFSAVPKATLQRDLRFKPLASIEISTALIAGIATALLAWFGYGVWSLAIGNLAGQLYGCLAANACAPSLILPKWFSERSKAMIRTGGHITASRAMWSIVSQSDSFIVGRMLGKDALGSYAVATQLSAMPMYKIMAIVNQVALTGFARIQHDANSVRMSIETGVALIAFIAFPVFWGISALSTELTLALLGSKWTEVALPLQLIPLIVPLRMIANFLSTAVQGIGKTEVDMQNTALSLILLPPAFFIGSLFGILGVCVAWLIAIPMLTLVNSQRLLAASGVDFRAVTKRMKSPIIHSLIAYAVVSLLGYTLPDELHSTLRLLLLFLAGASTYFGSFIALQRNEALSIWRIVRDGSRN